MKKSLCHLICVIFFVCLTSMMAMAQTTDNKHSSVPGPVSGYNGNMSKQNNWGLFGIIGAIALAGLMKRNVVQKN
jgi:hypothetical protein